MTAASPPDAAPTLDFAVARSRRCGRRPRRRCASRSRSTRASAAVRSVAARRAGADRRHAPPLRRRRAGAARRPVRRARALGRDAAHAAVAARDARRAAVRRDDDRAARHPLHVRLRGLRGALPRRRCATATCRWSCCSAAPSSTAAAGGAMQVSRIGWDRELACRLPVATWRAAIDQHFPHAAWLRLDRAAFDRLAAYRAQRALPSWEATLDALLAGAARDERRALADPVRAIADAVLYEGYVLWPYRRSALKNAQRWTFGGVYPRAHAAGRAPGDDPCVMQTQCLLEGTDEARVSVDVRFLHVVHRQATDRDGRPVDELVDERRAPPDVGRGGRARGRAAADAAVRAGRRRAAGARDPRGRRARSRSRPARSCAAGRRSHGTVDAARRAARACPARADGADRERHAVAGWAAGGS